MASPEKSFDGPLDRFNDPAVAADIEGSMTTGDVSSPGEQFEVFQQTSTGVNFRTVGWLRASTVFLKGQHLLTPHLSI